MNKKLELKHLAAYLPYELRVKYAGGSGVMESVNYNAIHTDNGGTLNHCAFLEFKPILRPLSDLTKEIEIGGEMIIPYKSLFENVDSDRDMLIWWYDTEIKLNSGNYGLVEYSIIEKLLEWHFDIFGLIESGLAIDINKL